ncbi:hypothetical protein HPG69_003142 [Diceros bicornis minor]|uniref:C-C motif chemokine n=1 Tax=Diceros bicornis minor TaxID=77932 RepID=A0A7J7EK05_DICBM|nr:hypothetical protein HPG69_003142 [Diceros bicornis minor]
MALSLASGFHSPADCCLAYTPRKIRCEVMKDYFETSTGCSQPGVIFLTKRGQRVCANPLEKRVRDCMRHLKLS